MSGGLNSIDAVKKKIKVLQEQAEEAEDRAERLQKEVEKEKRSREEVHTQTTHTCTGNTGEERRYTHLYRCWRRVCTQVLSDATNTCMR